MCRESIQVQKTANPKGPREELLEEGQGGQCGWSRGAGGNRSRWEEGEGRFPSRQSLMVEEYNFFNCGKIRINTHKFKCTV